METTMKFRFVLLASAISGVIMAIPVIIGIWLSANDVSGDWGYALCCVGPLWILAGGISSAWLYRRFGKTMTIKIGLLLGAVSGFIAGIVSLAPIIALLSYLAYSFGEGTFQGISEVISQVWAMGEEGSWFNLLGAILEYGIAWIVFGMVGGLLGAVVFREKKSSPVVNP
jgi:hypothetical protein